MEKESEIKVDMTLQRLSRIERILDYILRNNPELEIPEEEMRKINFQSLHDGARGVISPDIDLDPTEFIKNIQAG